jgi:3-methyladenine DNA glycosylase AlkD
VPPSAGPGSSGKDAPLRSAAIRRRLEALGDPERVRILQRFFKTAPGEYGEGDVFAGLYVPEIRKLALEYEALPLPEVIDLLHSRIHEARLLALLILVRAYTRGDAATRERIHRLYLENTRLINNWDLVDASAEHIVGRHLLDRDRAPLYALAASELLWDRRIAVMATFHFVKRGDFAETLRIAERLLRDREDLIHKAAGWMLREIGKRDRAAEEAFLQKHLNRMPRTMLRYAIEKFPAELRGRYLRGETDIHATKGPTGGPGSG